MGCAAQGQVPARWDIDAAADPPAALLLCRLPVVPTVTVLAIIKARLIGATKGHALLKKKADALNMRFRQVRHGGIG